MSEPIVFDAATPRHRLPLLISGQAQKEFFINESLSVIDMLLHPIVKGEAATPPADPQPGDCWIVGAAAGEAWSGREGAIAGWDGSQWTFAQPNDGLTVHDLSTGAGRRFTGVWSIPTTVSSPAGGSVVDIEARTAIDSLIFAVREAGIIF